MASCLRVSEAFREMRGAGFDPILIKGWAVARHYPEPHLRPFSDLDICVPSSQIERASAVLKELKLGSAIDLHASLRHLDTADWESVFKRSSIVPLNDVGIRVLAPEDHLRVLAVHWLNDGGAKLERLDDLFYTVSNLGRPFDWALCLQGIPVHRRQWIAKAVAVGIRFRGHVYTELPFTPDELFLPDWLLRTLSKEWHGEPLYPLYYLLGHPRRFFRQLAKRFPPNPIQATVEMDGSLEGGARFIYQMITFLKRIPTAFRMGARNIKGGER